MRRATLVLIACLPLTAATSGKVLHDTRQTQARQGDGRVLIVVRKVEGVWRIAAHQTVVRDQPE
jgi:hypothetical protein